MTFKRIFQSFILPLLALLAFLNFYKDISVHKLVEGLAKSNLYWIGLAMIMHLLNHFLRAYRWKQLLRLRGFNVYILHSVLAEMTGFFSNLFVPRLGEWTRCSALKHMSSVPIKESLPTVLVERTIDIFLFLIGFITLFIASFLLQGEIDQTLFLQFFQKIANSSLFTISNLVLFLLVFMLVGVGVFYLHKLFRTQFQYFFELCTNLLYSAKNTLLNIKFATWLITFLIWTTYFLVEYISCFALEATSKLGIFPIFFIFIVINLGMAMPVPGNVGAYHILMQAALSLFKVPHEAAVIYVTITHGIQVFNALVVGGLCTIASRYSAKKSKSGDVPIQK